MRGWDRGDRPWERDVAPAYSIAGIDPDTPVAGLGDPRRRERVSIVMMTDEERYALFDVSKRARFEDDRSEWWNTMSGRLVVILGIVLGSLDVLTRIIDAVHHYGG